MMSFLFVEDGSSKQTVFELLLFYSFVEEILTGVFLFILIIAMNSSAIFSTYHIQSSPYLRKASPLLSVCV